MSGSETKSSLMLFIKQWWRSRQKRRRADSSLDNLDRPSTSRTYHRGSLQKTRSVVETLDDGAIGCCCLHAKFKCDSRSQRASTGARFNDCLCKCRHSTKMRKTSTHQKDCSRRSDKRPKLDTESRRPNPRSSQNRGSSCGQVRKTSTYL